MPPNPSDALIQIFLSYAHEDDRAVVQLYDRLAGAGLKPWMDKRDILPGERWQTVLARAIRKSHFFLACLSTKSVEKRGYLQREFKQALDLWQEKLDGDIYLIPIRLDDCEVPEAFQPLQWVNLFEDDAWPTLLGAIRAGAERQGLAIPPELLAQSSGDRTRPHPARETPAEPRGESPPPQPGASAARQALTGPSVDLMQGLAAGEVCGFVGAGLSVGAGLPGWYDLIAELSARSGEKLAPREWATGDALIDAAQTYANRQGLNSLISFLKGRLDTTGRQPTAAHRALARLPISLVFTANFDDLLERAYRDAGKRVEVVTRDSYIPFMGHAPNTVNIVKLYGDLDQPDTIVLARQQYERYFLERPQLVKLLETELARSTMLYLGWSHTDPHFTLVFGEMLGRYQEFLRPGYAVMFEAPDAKRLELERKHIRLVQLPAEGDRTAELAAWLANLTP
jgi:hypothetical protein